MSEALRYAARAIFTSTLHAVDVGLAVRRRVLKQGDTLILAGKTVALSEVDRVIVIAMGKAAVPMYRAAAQALQGVAHEAVVIGPRETLPTTLDTDGSSQTLFLPGTHPTPTTESAVAAKTILHALTHVTSATVVLFLVSGGASAMVEQPLDPGITLGDLAAFSHALVGSGLTITAMNTLRKHLSAVKGGRLAGAAAPAKMQCTLLISDVPVASPDAIASGPSLPDSSTVADTKLLFSALQRNAAMPERITAWFESASLPETPKAGEAAFLRAHWEVVLSSDHLEQAAVCAAEAAGYRTVVDNTCDDWEYGKAADYLLTRSRAFAATHTGPTCIVSVGEVGVSLPREAGEGGRNQQFALWCARSLAAQSQAATVFSAGTDGVDGHSSAAGAVCDETTLSRALAMGYSVDAALHGFNATPLLHSIGDTLHTGPTGNNLRDLRLVLTEAALA